MKNKQTKDKLSIKELSIIAIFAALTAVLSQIAIPLPFSPVPISFGLVAVYISGTLLSPKQALLSQLCYLLLGAVGLPVFGNFRGGIPILFGSTGGYLLAYPISAWIIAVALNSRAGRQVWQGRGRLYLFIKSAIAISISHIVLYTGGTIWLCLITGSKVYAALSLAVFPFIPLDIVKILFCVFAIVPIRSRLISANILMLEVPISDSKYDN